MFIDAVATIASTPTQPFATYAMLATPLLVGTLFPTVVPIFNIDSPEVTQRELKVMSIGVATSSLRLFTTLTDKIAVPNADKVASVAFTPITPSTNASPSPEPNFCGVLVLTLLAVELTLDAAVEIILDAVLETVLAAMLDFELLATTAVLLLVGAGKADPPPPPQAASVKLSKTVAMSFSVVFIGMIAS